MKRIGVLATAIFLIGCNRSTFIYGNITPYIQLETDTSHELTPLNPDQLQTMIDEKKNFLFFLYSNTCSHCNTAKKDFIYPLMEAYDVRIYGMEGPALSQAEKQKFEAICYYSKMDYKGYPYLAVFYEGVMKQGENDYTNYQLFFTTFLILESRS